MKRRFAVGGVGRLTGPWTLIGLRDPCPAESLDKAILQGDTTSRLKHRVRQGDSVLPAQYIEFLHCKNTFLPLAKPEIVMARPSPGRHSLAIGQLRR